MKFGVRKPSVKRSISARTTGKLKRTVNRTVNPLYGKKGMGYINDPKKAVYNKVYNKTTVGVRDIIDSPKPKSSTTSYNIDAESYRTEAASVYPTPSIDLSKYNSPSKTYATSGTFLIITACIIAFIGLFTMPIGLLFIGLSIIFFVVGKTHKKVAKLKKYNETDLPPLKVPYIDDTGDIWEMDYKYDHIDIKLENGKFYDFKVNQIVEFALDGYGDSRSSVRIITNGKFVGYINTLGQRRMIIDYLQKDGHMVQAQFSFLSQENVFLRIIYYHSKKIREQEEAEARARYEAEKAAYVRKEPVSFDSVLVYNGSEKMQWEIQQVHIGDKIDVEPDDDDRYLVSTKASYDIGYLHKRISDKIDALINDGYEVTDGEITEITETSGKFGVKVHIVLEDTNYL